MLIDVYADWCPTCKQHAPILSELLSLPEFKGYTVLKVNFDTQKDVRRALGVAQQSTFIVYRGKREVVRTTGDTSKDSIAATLRKGLSQGPIDGADVMGIGWGSYGLGFPSGSGARICNAQLLRGNQQDVHTLTWALGCWRHQGQ